MQLEERSNVVALIQAVIAADGVIGDEEREFLRRVVAKCGFDHDHQADASPVTPVAPWQRCAPSPPTRKRA